MPRRLFYNTPTRFGRPWRLDAQHASEILEMCCRNLLGHYVGFHVLGRAVFQDQFSFCHLFTHKVITNVNVLGPLVKLGVLGQSDGTLIVFVDLDCFVAIHFAEFM